MQVVRAVIDGFLRGDPKTFQLIAEDVVYVWTSPFGVRTYHGHQGVLRWFTDWRAEWIDYELDLQRVEPLADRVLTVERNRATGKQSGVQVDMESFSLWTLRAGKVVRWQGYASEDEVRRAAASPSG